jgi:hypothetical protein
MLYSFLYLTSPPALSQGEGDRVEGRGSFIKKEHYLFSNT